MVVGIAPRPDARRRNGRQALPVAPFRDEPAIAMSAPVTETRDDLQPVPGPRRSEPAARQPGGPSPMDLETGTSEPGVQWTARTPAQRESATDQAVPHRDRDTGR